MDKLGDRMKMYEAKSGLLYIPGYADFIVRLDGNNFSKFTKPLPKPYDKVFSMVMMLTTRDLVEKYKAVTGYTHSDEITLIFKAQCTKEEYEAGGRTKKDFLHNGKHPKLLSLFASYCSVRFNYHYMKAILKEKLTNYDEDTNDKILSMHAVFDARFVFFPEEIEPTEITNHMIWRSCYDCYRNGSSTFADHYLGKKKTFGMKTREKVAMMRFQKILNFDTDVPMYYRHGSYVKRHLVEKEIEYVDKRTNEKKTTKAMRSEYVHFTMKVECTKPHVDLLMNKDLTDSSLVKVIDPLNLPYVKSSFRKRVVI